MKEVCGATSHIMKDELILGEHQVGGTRLLIYIYIYLYIDVVVFCHTYVTSKTLLHPYLLSFIVTMYWTKFLYEYIQIVVFLILYTILRVTF